MIAIVVTSIEKNSKGKVGDFKVEKYNKPEGIPANQKGG